MRNSGFEALGLALVTSLSTDYRNAFVRGDKEAMEIAKEGLSIYSAALPCGVDDFCKLIETNVR